MVRVRDVLGISAAALIRYGVNPDDDVARAIDILELKAPHLAKLLRSIANGAA
ncbi:hypothetical protein [Pyrobaculum aerophilum]|uniref:PaREP10 n=2 Tax=Pyrobaculum aerophilum TaxID=13773 RepID=Q8ZX40_PYRAE|nr:MULTISPECIES: hypothetical protein [Pyrobaculum]AAL63509.1 paREP10 [Pyrobaculum aerophilum str. IM2]MCX8135978.1 hypothetical protein [Pyrobaculum aerophilum]HII46377.1 hypothetical protein [Pyrobaculum aerophilum]